MSRRKRTVPDLNAFLYYGWYSWGSVVELAWTACGLLQLCDSASTHLDESKIHGRVYGLTLASMDDASTVTNVPLTPRCGCI